MKTGALHRPVLHWPYRLVASALAALFLATGAVDAYGLHQCPHHDGLPAAEAPADGHEHHAAEPSHGPDHGEDHGPCTCVGECGVVSAVLPGAAEPSPQPLVSGRADSPAATDRLIASRHRDYLHPFANAPPALR